MIEPTPGPSLEVHNSADSNRPQDTVVSFTTSRGSVYAYDEDGHTTRFKTVAGEEQPRQDLTVFVDVGVKEAGTVAAAYLLRSSTDKTKIEVIERQPDDSVRVVSDIEEVTHPDQLQVATFRGGRVIKSKPASLFPRAGAYVFDTRRFEENGVLRTERHLGHKVSSIQYRE